MIYDHSCSGDLKPKAAAASRATFNSFDALDLTNAVGRSSSKTSQASTPRTPREAECDMKQCESCKKCNLLVNHVLFSASKVFRLVSWPSSVSAIVCARPREERKLLTASSEVRQVALIGLKAMVG